MNDLAFPREPPYDNKVDVRPKPLTRAKPTLLPIVIGLLALSGLTLSSVASATNIVLIVSDDQGYFDLGCYGNTQVQTPVLDTLATEGVRCTDFYVTSPTCTPSRGGLLTLRYTQRYGFEDPDLTIGEVMGVQLSQQEAILPRYFRPAGRG